MLAGGAAEVIQNQTDAVCTVIVITGSRGFSSDVLKVNIMYYMYDYKDRKVGVM